MQDFVHQPVIEAITILMTAIMRQLYVHRTTRTLIQNSYEEDHPPSPQMGFGNSVV